MSDRISIPDESIISEESMPNIRVSFLCPEELIREIDARGDRSEVLRYMVGFYLGLVSIGRMRLQEEELFTEKELATIAAIAKPPPARPFEPELGSLVTDADPEVFASAGVDRELLFHKVINKLDDAKYEALEDAILRYRRAVATGMEVDVGGILR